VYATIFVISAFVLHFPLEALATFVFGAIAPDSVDEIAGPVVLVSELALAFLVTWLIVTKGGQLTRSEEDRRRGEAFLAEERLRFEAAEHEHLDRERLERLLAEVARWRQARDLRTFANEALEALGDGDVTTAEGHSLREELIWALSFADRIDPLRDRS
jgi:hypothetical protein